MRLSPEALCAEVGRRLIQISAGLLAAAALAAAPAAAVAQAPQPGAADAQREADRIQRQQSQDRLEEQRRALERAAPRTTLEAPTPPGPSAAAGGRCRQINEISFKGAFLLKPDQKAKLSAPYAGRCLNVADIEHLLADVTKAYIDRGNATTRAYIATQDLNQGKLVILVIEGRIGSIKARKGRATGVSIATAFPGLKGKVLSLRDLEQGLDQLNRLESNHATMDLVPGDKPGITDVVIDNKPTRRIFGILSYDNQGTRSTGLNQLSLTGVGEDLLGLNDVIRITRRQSDPTADASRSSSSENYFFSVPHGPWLASVGGSMSRYKTFVITASGAQYNLSGDSDTAYGRLDRVVLRSKTDIVTASATITWKRTENYFAGTLLTGSSRDLAILDLGASFSGPRLGGALNASLDYSRGLDALGAFSDSSGTGPKAQFDKLQLQANYYRPFDLGRRHFYFTGDFGAQYAFQALYSTEQFSIGGVGTVRGFRSSILGNDSGAYLHTDLGIIQPMPLPRREQMTVKAYAGVDAGYVGGRLSGTPSGTLTGIGIGTTLSWRRVALDVSVSQPLSAPSYVQRKGPLTLARITVKL